MHISLVVSESLSECLSKRKLSALLLSQVILSDQNKVMSVVLSLIV